MTLAAEGIQVRVVVLLLVLKTTEVEEMKEVTPFLAATVTVGPAGIVRKYVVVLVIPFGVEVLTLVLKIVLVCVIFTSGAAAVRSCSTVVVLLIVLVLPFGVDVIVEIDV